MDPGLPAARPATAPSWEIAGYIVLACLLCWLVALPGLIGLIPAEFAPALVPVAQLTPLVAAVAFLLWRRPGRAVDLLALRWNASARWAVIGVGTVAALSAMQLLAGLARGWQLNPSSAVLVAAVAVVPFLALQAVFAIGEELGWRGWLVSRTRHLGFVTMAAISAIAWTVWHIPAVVLFPDLSGAQTAAYLLAIASWAPFFVALRLVSGSVWPAVLLHGAVNSVRVFFLQSIATPVGVDWLVEILGWVLWLAAAVWLYRRHLSPAERAARRPADDVA